jgi:hypothetical protein
MKSRTALRLWPIGLLLAATVCVEAAFTAGGVAYTKRYKTTLLAEPSPQAKSTGELAFARKVKVEQLQGNWLRVSDGSSAGWVFLGSLSETKPDESKGLDGAPLLASSTTATAAARPLTPAADEYSQRRNLGSASDDLNWLLNTCSNITPGQVETYLKTHKKGEYQ